MESREKILCWSLLSSCLLHGLMVSLATSWNFSAPKEIRPNILTVQIVSLTPPPPAPRPKTVAPPKEKKRPSPSVITAAKGIKPPVLPLTGERPGAEGNHPSPTVAVSAGKKPLPAPPLTGENLRAEENPKEERTEKVDPGRFGDPGGSRGEHLLAMGKQETDGSPAADSGPVQQGISGGLAAIHSSGQGSGAQAVSPGGIDGGKGTVPEKGVKTGSLYFQGEGKGTGNLGSYLANARLRIEKAKRYPREARRRGWEGKVVFSFQINRNGDVAEIKLVRSSGHPELDEEGMATLRRASPFSPPPLADGERFDVEIPLVFRLEGRR